MREKAAGIRVGEERREGEYLMWTKSNSGSEGWERLLFHSIREEVGCSFGEAGLAVVSLVFGIGAKVRTI